MKNLVTVTSVQEALAAIDAHEGPPEDFVLRMPHALITPVNVGGQMITGMQMTLITDQILGRNWCPKGFVDEGKFRTYTYGAWDNV